MNPSTLDKRICPGCGRRPRRVHACAHCQWTADPGRIPTVRELLDGAADGFIADGVDLGRFVRALLRVAHGRADEIIGALLAGPMPTAAQVRAEYDAAGLDYDAAEAKVLATIDEIDRRQNAALGSSEGDNCKGAMSDGYRAGVEAALEVAERYANEADAYHAASSWRRNHYSEAEFAAIAAAYETLGHLRDEISSLAGQADNNCNTGHGPGGASE